MKGKKRINIFSIILCIFVFGALLFGIGKLGGSYYKKIKGRAHVEDIKTKKYDIDLEEISIDDEEVKKAMDSFGAFRLDEKIYSGDSFEPSQLTKYDYIVAAISSVDSEKIAYCISSNEELKEPINLDYLNEKELKFTQDPLTTEDLLNNSVENGLTVGDVYYYDYALKIDGDSIYVVGPCEGRTDFDQIHMTKVVKAEKYGEYLNIYQKIAFGKISENGYDWYNNIDRDGEPFETLDSNDSPSFNKKYPTYKFTFKLVDGHYYFQGVENRL